jgi:hypothetical protein
VLDNEENYVYIKKKLKIWKEVEKNNEIKLNKNNDDIEDKLNLKNEKKLKDNSDDEKGKGRWKKSRNKKIKGEDVWKEMVGMKLKGIVMGEWENDKYNENENKKGKWNMKNDNEVNNMVKDKDLIDNVGGKIKNRRKMGNKENGG